MNEQDDPAAYAERVMRIEAIVIDAKGDVIKEKVPELLPEDFIFYRDHVLMQHQNAQDAIEAAKAYEMHMRKRSVDFIFDPNKKTGTERVELGNGWQVKSVKKLNFSWIKAEDGIKINRKAINAALEEIENSGPEGVFIADRLVKWNPDLAEGEYNKLAETHPHFRKIIDRVIVTTDAAPKLDIIPPKEKK